MTKKKKRSSDRLNILLFFYRKQFIQLKPIRAMISEAPLKKPRAPSAEAAVTELRPSSYGQQVFTIDAMRLLAPLALHSMA